MSLTRVLVTGGAGLIGLEVCNQLSQRQDLEVRLFDLPEQVMRVKRAVAPGVRVFYGSILDASSLRDVMEGCDAVVHLAAMLGVRRTELQRLRCLEINVEGTKNVLESAVQHRVGKLVFGSSGEVYGEPLFNPVSEETPTHGSSVYAISKLAGEELCRAYSQRFPWLAHTSLRYFNTYGPYQPTQFVIPRFVANVLKGEPPVIYGEGTQKRSYSYVSDTAAATVAALEKEEANGQVFNVGNGERITTLWALADIVIERAGKKGALEPLHQPDFSLTDRIPEREILMRFCDTSKARKRLGYQPKVPLEEGIGRLLQAQPSFDQWATSSPVYLQDDDA